MSGIRVIGGSARGRRLKSVPGDSTRPITDRAKESLFNILAPDLRGASMLDLFAGTGSVGIEALSRGAKFVRFVDKHPLAIRTVRENLLTTNLAQNANVQRTDAFTKLASPADMQFDYIFIAPPQYKNLWERALKLLDQHIDWLVEDAWVIVQIDPVEYKPLELTYLNEIDQRKYGSTIFIFYERVQS